MKRRPPKPPAYPTKADALAEPNWLERHFPEAWRKLRPFALAFLGRRSRRSRRVQGDFFALTGSGSEVPVSAVVAPLFDHGEGRGAVGCIVVSPPVFLPEDEAFAIISEELGKQGIHFGHMDVLLNDVLIAAPSLESFYGRTTAKDVRPPVSLSVSRLDAVHRVGVEFVAGKKSFELGSLGEDTGSIMSFDFRGVAEELSAKLQTSRTRAYFGIFYDPAGGVAFRGCHIGRKWKRAKEQVLATSREELRLQVQDFVKWLREQKVIE